MRMKKSVFAVVLSFLVIISQAGCGSGGGSAPAAGSALGGGSNGEIASTNPTGDTAPAAGTAGSTGGTTTTGGTATNGGATSGGVVPTGVAKLSWNPPADAIGVKIHYGTSPGSYSNTIDVGMVSSYSLNGLPAGTYYFVVTAYDAGGYESLYSNEVSKTIS
jgi:hypothetical protein